MRLTWNLDPKPAKICLILVLIFLNSLLTPIYLEMSQGQYPTELDLWTAVIGAILNVVLYLMTFLGVKPPAESPAKAKRSKT